MERDTVSLTDLIVNHNVHSERSVVLTWTEESRINEGTPVFWRSSRASTSFAVLSLLYDEVARSPTSRKKWAVKL